MKPELPFTLKEKLLRLKDDLEKQNPGYATVLSEIHQITKQNPDFVYSLSDEEFVSIVQGLGKLTKVTIEAGKKKMTKKDGELLSEDSV
jgi:hypothetical protein